MILQLIALLAMAPTAQAAESAFGWKYETIVKAEEVHKIESAAAFLARTPTGKEVLAAFKAFPVTLTTDAESDSNGFYDDETSSLFLNPKAVKQWPDWKLARLMCHELTHAVQHSLGIDRAHFGNNPDKSINASGIVEFAALSMEVRYWIEAGAPVDSVRDFNSLRMWAYLFFPETVRVGWAYSNGSQRFKEPVRDWGGELLAGYWEKVLESEKGWRALQAKKFPPRFQEKEIALEYLMNRFPKPVSPWLPAYLENLGIIPGTATANDLELIKLHRLGK